MTQYRNERNGDVVTVPKELEKKYDEKPQWSRVTTGASELKGAELDAALKAAGLSTSGSADEKRARLAEHQNREENQ